LNYRFTSSKINGRRKTEAVSVSIAADKLLPLQIERMSWRRYVSKVERDIVT
jgi:hypothetical protein